MNGWPNSARNGLSTQLWHWVTDTIKATVIDLGAFTPTLAMDFRNDITAGVIAEVTLTGKAVGSLGTGIASHSDAVFTAVTGASFEQLLYWKDTGTSSTSPLIIWNDTFTQVIPNGENIGLVAASGVYGISQVT
jgi:hypothetical protein